jgi:hypothetical protein
MKVGRALMVMCVLCLTLLLLAGIAPGWSIPILVCATLYVSYRYGRSRWA